MRMEGFWASGVTKTREEPESAGLTGARPRRQRKGELTGQQGDSVGNKRTCQVFLSFFAEYVYDNFFKEQL